MSRSFINLRRVLFGVSCAVVFGFGATTAFATPDTAARKPTICVDGTVGCWCMGSHFCVEPGTCECY